MRFPELFLWVPSYIRTLALAAALFVPLGALAKQTVSPPTYELQISFDPERSKLFGKAVIHERRGRQLNIGLGDLTVLRLSNGGRELPVPSVKGEAVKLRADGLIEIDYEANFGGSDDNLVRADAVQLQGLWYPSVAGMYVYQLSATFPEGFTVVSEAEAIRQASVPAGVRFDFDFRHPLAAADGVGEERGGRAVR